MTKENSQINIDIGTLDVFPAIIDYDFVKNRPRGGSSRIDFFCYGRLAGTLDKVASNPYIFVKKDRLFFERGLFLVDFSTIEERGAEVGEMIKNMGEKTVYLENSTHYKVDNLMPYLDGIEIILMNFNGDANGS